jgi:hypothetical protein
LNVATGSVVDHNPRKPLYHWDDQLRWTSQISLGSPFRKHHFRILVIIFPACLFIAGCARSFDVATTVDARRFLNDRELDSVTAGGVKVDLELSASAEGPAAVTSTQGSIITARATVLKIAVDPSAPAPARARLLGISTAELLFAMGKANAAGTSDVQCSAVANAAGDAAYTLQSRIATAISAVCSCSAFAVGIIQQ